LRRISLYFKGLNNLFILGLRIMAKNTLTSNHKELEIIITNVRKQSNKLYKYDDWHWVKITEKKVFRIFNRWNPKYFECIFGRKLITDEQQCFQFILHPKISFSIEGWNSTNTNQSERYDDIDQMFKSLLKIKTFKLRLVY